MRLGANQTDSSDRQPHPSILVGEDVPNFRPVLRFVPVGFRGPSTHLTPLRLPAVWLRLHVLDRPARGLLLLRRLGRHVRSNLARRASDPRREGTRQPSQEFGRNRSKSIVASRCSSGSPRRLSKVPQAQMFSTHPTSNSANPCKSCLHPKHKRFLEESQGFRVWTPLRHGSIPCPIPGVGSSAFVCPACCRGAFMAAAGLHGDARTGSKSLLRARRRLESPPVFPIPSRRLFALALSSVFPASPATPTSALSQAKVEPRKTSFFISTFVPAAPAAARLPGGRGSSAAFLRRRDGPDHPRHPVRQRRRGRHPINKTHLTLRSASASFAPMILQGGLVMEKLQRRFGAGIGVWFREAASEEGRTRGSLARGLCEVADWRNAKGEFCLASARRALPRLASDLGVRLPAVRKAPLSARRVPSDQGVARRSRGGPARACGRRGGRPGLAVDDGAPASAGRALVSGGAASLLDRLGAARPSGRDRLQGRRLAFEGARRVHRLEPPGAGGEPRSAG